jgi:hypothetical protein
LKHQPAILPADRNTVIPHTATENNVMAVDTEKSGRPLQNSPLHPKTSPSGTFGPTFLVLAEAWNRDVKAWLESMARGKENKEAAVTASHLKMP